MFKDLQLDNRKIEEVINIYFQENFKTHNITKEEKQEYTRYYVEYDGKKLFLSVYINGKGRSTLKVKEGKEQEEKEKLARFIAENPICKLADKNTGGKYKYYRNVDRDLFEQTINMIDEDKEICLSIDKRDLEDRTIYSLKGTYKDEVTVTYFNTSTVGIQGLPLLLYNYCQSAINEIIEDDDLIDVLNESNNTDIDKLSVEEQYKYYLPNSYDKHTEKIRKSLLKAVYNTNIDSQEYTCTELVFEVLRGLEGHIKQTLFNDYEIKSSKKFGNLDMFSYNYETEEASITKGIEDKIKEKADRVSYYKKAYKHYCLNRNKYFHWDFPGELGVDETHQIDDINIAKQLIFDTLAIIDEYYTM